MAARSPATSQENPEPSRRRSFMNVGRLFSRLTATGGFDLEQYLTTRKRSPLESRFDREVQQASDGRLTVEDVQRLLNTVHSKVEAMRLLLMQLDLHSPGETDRFTQLLSRLWENTPRKDLGGATPAANLRKETSESKSAAVGRNDACPCGSGKKYKNCCVG